MSEIEKKTMDTDSRALLESIPKRGGGDGSRNHLLTTNFSRIGHVSREGGYVYGGWSPTFQGACGPVMVTGIPEGAVTQLVQQGTCPDGEPIMLCEHY